MRAKGAVVSPQVWSIVEDETVVLVFEGAHVTLRKRPVQVALRKGGAVVLRNGADDVALKTGAQVEFSQRPIPQVEFSVGVDVIFKKGARVVEAFTYGGSEVALRCGNDVVFV